MHDALMAQIADKKRRLDELRPLSGAALAQLQKHFDVELTYTSNAIEGNRLTLRETAEVIEHGITVGGKPLRDHLEAVDLYEALGWMRVQAATATPIDDSTICELHRRIVLRSQPSIAGIYSRLPRRIAGASAVFPNPAKIPDLMQGLGTWQRGVAVLPAVAFEAHFRLTAIHPFADGNGRVARLLMNLMLLRAGFPPIAVRPDDRRTYLDAVERGSLAEDLGPFQAFMHGRLDATLDAYLALVGESLPPS